MVKERWVTHYSSTHNILLVGEGDFSFSASLAKAFHSAKNMVATSFDYEDELESKHWSAADHVKALKARGCTVLHGIDVYDMHEHEVLKTMAFDRILYNFPHAGHDPLYYEKDDELIRRHKELVGNYFASAREMLRPGSEVHLTHRNDEPYAGWEIEKLAMNSGLELLDMVEFRKVDYPGYHNKSGGGINSNETFPLRDCYTFKFKLGSKVLKEDGNLNIGEGGVLAERYCSSDRLDKFKLGSKVPTDDRRLKIGEGGVLAERHCSSGGLDKFKLGSKVPTGDGSLKIGEGGVLAECHYSSDGLNKFKLGSKVLAGDGSLMIGLNKFKLDSKVPTSDGSLKIGEDGLLAERHCSSDWLGKPASLNYMFLLSLIILIYIFYLLIES